MYFLYHQRFPEGVDDKDQTQEEGNVESSRSLVRDYLEVWLLFDFLLRPDAQNHTMSKLCSIAKDYYDEPNLISAENIRLIAEDSNEELLRFTLEVVVLAASKGTWSAAKVSKTMDENGRMSNYLEASFAVMHFSRKDAKLSRWDYDDLESGLWKGEGRLLEGWVFGERRCVELVMQMRRWLPCRTQGTESDTYFEVYFVWRRFILVHDYARFGCHIWRMLYST